MLSGIRHTAVRIMTRPQGSLGHSSKHDVLRKYVSLLSYIVNCQNYEYYTVCDIYMCSNMDLTMYSYIFEDCVINPRGDKC